VIEPLLSRATLRDETAVHGLLVLAGESLAKQGFRNWTPPFALSQVRAEIATREVYLASSGPRSIATVSIAEEPVRPYEPGFWGSEIVGAGAYMNRLAVDPSVGGAGIGSWCVQQIHGIVQARGYAFIRCDVLHCNIRLRRFYERLGYTVCGERSHSGWDFACYQVPLTCTGARQANYAFKRTAGTGHDVS